jgi:hypothetical protein
MRRALLATVLSSLIGFTTPAAAETSVHLGGGPRWGSAGNEFAMVLRASTGLAPLVDFGVELYGLCTGGHELALDFGGGAVSALVSPPKLGPLGFQLGLEAGIVPLTADLHGHDGLSPYLGIEAAASLELGSLVSLRLAYDHLLIGDYARRALESQLLLMVGVRL